MENTAFLNIQPIHHPSVRRSSHVAEKLREMITEGTLKPGDRLPAEGKLCQYFGVSRTTLREAIQMLRVASLLDVAPGRGSYVRLPDPAALLNDLVLLGRWNNASLTEATGLQHFLAVEMVRRASQAATAAKKDLHAHALGRDASPKENAQAEAEWHTAIARAGGGELTATITAALCALTQQERERRFQDSDEVMRTISTQIRVNTAVMEGGADLAARVLSGYLMTSLSQGTMAA